MAQYHHLFYVRELDIDPIYEQIGVNIFDEQTAVILVLIMAVYARMLKLTAKDNSPSVQKLLAGVIRPEVLKCGKFIHPRNHNRMKRFKHIAVLLTAVDQVRNPGGAASAIADNPDDLFGVFTFGVQVKFQIKVYLIT